MPYARDETALQTAIRAVLRDPADSELRPKAADHGLRLDLLVERLHADQIWEAASTAIAEHDAAERQLEAAKAQVAAVAGQPLGLPQRIVIFLRGLGGLALAAAAARYAADTVTWLAPLRQVPAGFAVSLGIAGFIVLMVAVWLEGRERSASTARETRMRERLDVTRLEKSVETAAERVKIDLMAGIRAQLRELIGLEVEKFSTELPSLHAPGLSEVFNLNYEIATDGKEKLKGLLDGMPGGSIGIAGPRGAGKTTLMWAFCSGVLAELKDRTVLPVLIPAPVNYEAREFILHLFASVCEKARELEGAPRVPETPQIVEHPEAWRVRLNTILVPVLSAVGAVLFAMGVGAAFAKAYYDHQWGGPVYAYVNALELPAASLVLVGAVLLGAAVLADYLRTRVEPEPESELAMLAGTHITAMRFQQSYSSGWSGSLSLPVIEGGITRAVEVAQQQLTLPEVVYRYRKFAEQATTKTSKALSEEGTAKGPKPPYLLIIGIDELDKIGDDRKAHQFLNDIKAVFGLDNCFYLISVSESAINSFERRGLPFRDAFDSAFDTVVYVDYLTLERSKRLLRRRLIGLPFPYLWLSHVLAGGLPRDLIRICREIVALGQETAPLALSLVCQKLTTRDLAAKMRAVTAAAQRMGNRAAVAEFLTEIEELKATDVDPAELINWTQKLLSTAADPTRWKDLQAAPRNSVGRLQLELIVYVGYLSTLLELFHDGLTPEETASMEKDRTIETLARVRQAFSSDPLIAAALLDRCRAVRGYPPIVPFAASAHHLTAS